MLLSESYKKRLLELAGIPDTSVLNEITDLERTAAFAASDQRIPYNKDLMIQAIKQGREVGVLFQSNNEKYKMPVAKYRIILPVALGTSKSGNSVIRVFHKIGQSESEAIRTGIRSAEIENGWRLMKVSNIKSMWMTGRYFQGPLESYNSKDKSMLNVEFSADFNEIIKYQNNLIKDIRNKEEQEQKRKNIIKLFKEKPEERPLEIPVKQPEEQSKIPVKVAKEINKK